MFKTVLAACLLLFAFLFVSPAEARTHRGAHQGPWSSCVPTNDVMHPCAYQPNFLAGVKSIHVVLKRDRVS